MDIGSLKCIDDLLENYVPNCTDENKSMLRKAMILFGNIVESTVVNDTCNFARDTYKNWFVPQVEEKYREYILEGKTDDNKYFVRMPDYKVENIDNCIGCNKDLIRKRHIMFSKLSEASDYANALKRCRCMDNFDFNKLKIGTYFGYC